MESQESQFFPKAIARAMADLLRVDPSFPEDLPYAEQELWEMRFLAWEQGLNVEEGVAMLHERAALKRCARRSLPHVGFLQE